MDIIEKIGIGLAIPLIAAIVMYAFKIRQLYLLVPKMFDYSGITERGKILELRAFNRGRSMEEDVHIDMPPAFTYELIAADVPNVRLDKNKLVLTRILPKSEVSIVLLTEGNIGIESFSPTICSKTTKGKIVATHEGLPWNWGNVVIFLGGYFFLISLILIVPAKWAEHQKALRETEFSFLKEAGWRDFDSFVSSEVRGSYPGYDFPIILNSVRHKGDHIEVGLLATNKTAATLLVTAYFKTDEENPAIIHTDYPERILVSPMQSIPIVVGANIRSKLDMDKLHVFVIMVFGKDQLFYASFYPSLNKNANQALQGKPASKRP